MVWVFAGGKRVVLTVDQSVRSTLATVGFFCSLGLLLLTL